jgi:hypothetical protein
MAHFIPSAGTPPNVSCNSTKGAQSVTDQTGLMWPAPGSEDTELGVLMELEVGHGETEVYARVQA